MSMDVAIVAMTRGVMRDELECIMQALGARES
jgi:hypothetical protein